MTERRIVKVGRWLRVALLQCGLTALVLLGVELGARALTLGPHGHFRGWFPGRLGLYPENETLPMYGVVNWQVRTNRWGFRGGDLALEKAAGVTRIAMLGDSVTDGFSVENENTYPARTEARLRAAGARAEVINAAHGGASIPQELAILREAVARFAPDVVVLTFVTNDVDALFGLDDEQLLRHSLTRPNLKRSLLRAVVVETALGELLFDRYLRWVSTAYARNQEDAGSAADRSPARYRMADGRSFAANSRHFMERFRDGDALLLRDDRSPAVEHLLRRYLEAWDAFVDEARAHGMRPVFVYCPAYPQIYDPAISTSVRDRLQRRSEERSVPFLDLTPALRAQGEAVLHLAPVDYHLNPEGNRVIGTALADFLLERGLVAGRQAGSWPP